MTIRKQTRLWTTRDGSRVRICDMGDDHLLAAMRMLIRYAKHRKRIEDIWWLECPEPSGEMACDDYQHACDQAWNTPWQDYLPSIYGSMQEDAARRGLEHERIDKVETGAQPAS